MEKWITVDGVSYPCFADYVSTGIYDLCGCVDAEGILNIIDKTFNHFHTAIDRGVYWEALVEEVFNGNEVFAYWVASVLDSKGQLEHGIAIRGSWITEEGYNAWDEELKSLEDHYEKRKREIQEERDRMVEMAGKKAIT